MRDARHSQQQQHQQQQQQQQQQQGQEQEEQEEPWTSCGNSSQYLPAMHACCSNGRADSVLEPPVSDFPFDPVPATAAVARSEFDAVTLLHVWSFSVAVSWTECQSWFSSRSWISAVEMRWNVAPIYVSSVGFPFHYEAWTKSRTTWRRCTVSTHVFMACKDSCGPSFNKPLCIWGIS